MKLAATYQQPGFHRREIWHSIIIDGMISHLAANAKSQFLGQSFLFIARHPLSFIVAAYLGLAFTFSAVTPIFEAPDETGHFFFARQLAVTGRIPVLREGVHELWSHEAAQPPLYHLVVATFVRLIDTSDAESYVWLNPQVNLGDPKALGNKNFLIHTDKERFPYSGTALAVHVARWVNLGFGLWTVVATYFLAREVGSRIAIPAAMFVAFLPQFLFLSGACTNDIAIAATATSGLFFLVRLMRHPYHLAMSIGLGVAVGLALLAKGAGILLFLLAIYLTLVLTMKKTLSLKQMTLTLTAIVVSALLIAGWWYWRNWTLYGEWTGQKAMLLVLGERLNPPRTLPQLTGELRGLACFPGLVKSTAFLKSVDGNGKEW